jgi:hypothetical protein
LLTIRALSDYDWCPTLFRDTEGNKKRFKDDRHHADETLEQIYTALVTRNHNKVASISPIRDGVKAEPYGTDFWAVITVEDTQLLIPFTEVRLTKAGTQPWVFTLRRTERRRPNSDSRLQVEIYFRHLLARALREVVPSRLTIKTETKYEGQIHPDVSDEPTPEEMQAVEQYVEEVRKAESGEISLVPRTDRCPMCWWRRQCPVSQEIERVRPENRTSGPILNIN